MNIIAAGCFIWTIALYALAKNAIAPSQLYFCHPPLLLVY